MDSTHSFATPSQLSALALRFSPDPPRAVRQPTRAKQCFVTRKRVRWLRAILAAVAATSAWHLPLQADDRVGPEHSASTFTVIEENDLLWNPVGDHTDRHYTQGLKLTYLGGTDQFTNLADRLAGLIPSFGIQATQVAFGFAVGQNIYTPEDYSVAIPDPDDRPYAGWLYGELIYQRREPTRRAAAVALETFTLSLGVVGPESLGEVAQNSIHRIRGFPLARGWDAQLKPEPAFLLKYDRRWRLTWNEATRPVVDVIPHMSGNLGNVQISAEAGAMIRVGWNLPDDYGIVRIDSASSPVGMAKRGGNPWSVYIYGEATGRALAHSLFLDGNSFRNGPSVDREPLIADLTWGLSLKCGRHLDLSYGWVCRTEEFKTQHGADQFGSFSLRVTFGFDPARAVR